MSDVSDGLSAEALSGGLRAAGFRLLEARYDEPSMPVEAAWAVTSLQPGDGGRMDVTFDLGQVDLVDRLNSAWRQVVENVPLKDDAGRFLLSVTSDESGLAEPHWALVEQSGQPDVAGIGAARGVFGFRPGYVEFASASLDGHVVVRGTLWQSSVGILTVRDARGSVRLQEYVRGLIARESLPDAQLENARRWVGA